MICVAAANGPYRVVRVERKISKLPVRFDERYSAIPSNVGHGSNSLEAVLMTGSITGADHWLAAGTARTKAARQTKRGRMRVLRERWDRDRIDDATRARA